MIVPFPQGFHDEAPYVLETDPRGHTEQFVDPTVSEYVPGRQNSHSDPALEE